jgi:hypothetical protein
MRNFFHRWQRTSGWVSFAMAMAALVMLARSYFIYDMMGFHWNGRQFMFQSFNGYLKWSGWTPRPDVQLFKAWESVCPDHEQTKGIIVRQLAIDGHRDSMNWLVSYWWIIIPLLMLSACLILWKGTNLPSPE